MASRDPLSVRVYGNSPGSHDHPHFQILFGLEGALELEVDGRGYRIATGDGRVVPPGARHDFEARTGSRCLVLDSTDVGWSRQPVVPVKSPALQSLAQFLTHAVTAQTGDTFPLVRNFGHLLLHEAWAGPDDGRKRVPAGRRIDWTALTAWTASHWHDALTVDDLAAQVHLSASQFTVRCRQEIGMGPMQWLRLQRLAHAQYLQQQGQSVAETARRCGYRSPSALTAAMRRQYGA